MVELRAHEPRWCHSASGRSKKSMRVDWEEAKMEGMNLVNKS